MGKVKDVVITFTIEDVLKDNIEDVTGRKLYVFRDGGTIFYVGMTTRHVLTRVLEHLGRGDFPSYDRVHRLVKENLPQSLEWEIDLYKPRYETTAPAITKDDIERYPDLAMFGESAPLTYYSKSDIEQTETELIAELRPALNVRSNRNKKPLPDRYIGERKAIAGIEL